MRGRFLDTVFPKTLVIPVPLPELLPHAQYVAEGVEETLFLLKDLRVEYW